MSNASILKNLVIDESSTEHRVDSLGYACAHAYARLFAKRDSKLPIFAFYELTDLKVSSFRIDVSCGCSESIDKLTTPELNLRVNSRRSQHALELRFPIDDQLEQKLTKRLKAKRTNPVFIPLLELMLNEFDRLKHVAAQVRERTISEFNQAAEKAVWGAVKNRWEIYEKKLFTNRAGEQFESISDDTKLLGISFDKTERYDIIVTIA